METQMESKNLLNKSMDGAVPTSSDNLFQLLKVILRRLLFWTGGRGVGVVEIHGNWRRVGLMSRWSALLCRPPVKAAIRKLVRKYILVSGARRLRFFGIDYLELSSSNPLSDRLAG